MPTYDRKHDIILRQSNASFAFSIISRIRYSHISLMYYFCAIAGNLLKQQGLHSWHLIRRPSTLFCVVVLMILQADSLWVHTDLWSSSSVELCQNGFITFPVQSSSSCLLRLCQKAFFNSTITWNQKQAYHTPFPLLVVIIAARGKEAKLRRFSNLVCLSFYAMPLEGCQNYFTIH